MVYVIRFFTTIGVATAIFTSVCFSKLFIALKSQVDFTAALTSPPPRTAFSNKVFWITGASSGIGRALALHLCSNHDNTNLILSSRREKALQEVASECEEKGSGAQIKILPLDLADIGALKSKAETAIALFDGRIDILVNNGGVSTRAMARDSTFEVHPFVMNVDFLSYVALTKALLPTWELQISANNKAGLKTRPIIINTSSFVGRLAAPVRTIYSGAKHAIMGWYDAFRLEQMIVGYPIDVLNVVLGSARTNVAKNGITESPDKKFGGKDDNIENGLEPAFVVERILASAYAGQDELWIAPRKELFLLYLNQYIPITAKKILGKAVAKQYAVQNEKTGEEKEL
eukprot:2587624-Ditylum_brightwellii.AAC.1